MYDVQGQLIANSHEAAVLRGKHAAEAKSGAKTGTMKEEYPDPNERDNAIAIENLHQTNAGNGGLSAEEMVSGEDRGGWEDVREEAEESDAEELDGETEGDTSERTVVQTTGAPPANHMDVWPNSQEPRLTPEERKAQREEQRRQREEQKQYKG
jgi:hypothetical protein